MSPTFIGLTGLIAMLGLIAAGIPISIALLATGAIGLAVIGGPVFAETQLVLNLWDEGTNFALTAIPLYLLMGQLVFRDRSLRLHLQMGRPSARRARHRIHHGVGRLRRGVRRQRDLGADARADVHARDAQVQV